jgi:drug/metabolite transporter (DMT)-like permease
MSKNRLMQWAAVLIILIGLIFFISNDATLTYVLGFAILFAMLTGLAFYKPKK